MFRRFSKLTALVTFGTIGTCIIIPKQYYPGKLKPINHLLNVVGAGANMIMIYKYSVKSPKQKHLKASQCLRDALLKNGGIYIKLGQIIATLDVIVPDQYRDTMLTLTRGCEVSQFKKIKKIIQQQTNMPLQQTFLQFSQYPISSASIGQVHKAKLKTGQQVAVKIQHPNLSQNVYYDLKLMEIFVYFAKKLFNNFQYQWLLQEFQKNIQKQLNFLQQAANMKIISDILKKQKFNNVIVPKLLYPPTKKLLIMQYFHGYHIDQISKMKQSNINMKQIGKTFSKVIIKMIHKWGFVHADPHSGNLLVHKNNKDQDQLILLDHGLCLIINPQTRQQYNWFWLGLILNDSSIATKAANYLGTKDGLLLCSVLTSQTREQLTSQNRKIFDLNPKSQRQIIMKKALESRPQIVTLLNQVRRQILLLMKINQFARTIQNMLGGRQTGVYEDIAKCCLDNLPISRFQKLKYQWRMWRASRKC